MTEDRFALWDGAYVLGSLSTADRHDFEDHLRDCARCSASVAELSVLPGLLGAVPHDVAVAEATGSPWLPQSPGPSPGSEDRFVAAIRTHRRRTRIRDGLVAATVASAIAVPVGLFAGHHHPSDDVALRPMTDIVPTVIDAGVALTPHPWGTTVSVRCTYRTGASQRSGRYGTETEHYALTVTDSSGRVTQLATWIGGPGATVNPEATTAIPAASIRRIDIRATDTDTVLLTAPE